MNREIFFADFVVVAAVLSWYLRNQLHLVALLNDVVDHLVG